MNRYLKLAILILADTVSTALAALFTVYLVANKLSSEFLLTVLPFFAVMLITTYLAFTVFGLYRGVWRYAGVKECLRIGTTHATVFLVALLLCAFFEKDIRYAVCYTVFLFVGTLAIRLSGRFAFYMRDAYYHAQHRGQNVIIIGAGDAGRSLLREIRSSDFVEYQPVCFLDDDPNKVGMSIDGVSVFGTTDEIEEAVAKYHATGLMVAMPSVSKARIKEILEKCRKTGLRTQTLPGMYQLVNGEVHISSLRDIEIADLLGREQIRVNLDEIMGYIENRVVLVTGGGGSIGSELCRQIAAHDPKLLIILDIYENNAYGIEQELHRQHPEVAVLTLIASIRDEGKMEDVFRTYRPSIVFNAAAHKHVPLMETSPNEAVKNNVMGTLNLARMADKYGVYRFVQISTDKAVNPTNVMGATKRLCEMIIQSFSRKSKTEFVAVRFGNVLGSNGSVVGLFKQQIAEGGPVTVTHKDIIRYFMTIPEAVSLVLQAGAYAKGGEIFVLDMGEPVRIYDLAENLIRLSGLEPGVDIEIRCTGLRPGEKLYEERLMEEEGLRTTPNGMISIARPIFFEDEPFYEALRALREAAYAETDRMKEMVADLVPTYQIDHTAEEAARSAAQSSATNT